MQRLRCPMVCLSTPRDRSLISSQLTALAAMLLTTLPMSKRLCIVRLRQTRPSTFVGVLQTQSLASRTTKWRCALCFRTRDYTARLTGWCWACRLAPT